MPWSAVQCALLAIVLSLLCLTLGVNCQPTNTSSLHSLFAPSLQPVAVNFLPAQSSVIFLSRNQSHQTTSPFANLLLVPSGVTDSANHGSDPGSDQLGSDQLGSDQEVDAAGSGSESVDQAPKAGQASIENNTLFLSNPFASTPYQSNTETINSLIANIFGKPSLQSLPPEELIFGALPSPNATVTRTFVESVFRDDQPQGEQTQPPSFPQMATESPSVVLPPADNNIPPEVESDVNVLSNHVATFGDIVGNTNEESEEQAWSGEGHSTVEPESGVTPSPPVPPTTTESSPEPISEEPVTPRPLRRFNLPRPHFPIFSSGAQTQSPQAAAAAAAPEEPVTVAPVAPTLSADFESNRIDSLPPWSTVNRIVRPPLPAALPITIRPSLATTEPTITPSPPLIEKPVFVNRREPPQTGPALPPPPIASLESFKFSKPIKLNSISRRQKLDRKHFKFTGKSYFTFELNNKKIVGGTSDRDEVFPNRLNKFFKPSKAAELGIKLPPPTLSAVSTDSLDSLLNSADQSSQSVPQSPAQALGSIFPFALGPDSVDAATTKWRSTLENIISLPNYKFYLGRKT